MSIDALLLAFWGWLTLGIDIGLGPFLCFLLAVALAWYCTRQHATPGVPREGAR